MVVTFCAMGMLLPFTMVTVVDAEPPGVSEPIGLATVSTRKSMRAASMSRSESAVRMRLLERV